MPENMRYWICSAKTVVSNIGGGASDTKKKKLFAVFLSQSLYLILLITGYLCIHYFTCTTKDGQLFKSVAVLVFKVKFI